MNRLGYLGIIGALCVSGFLLFYNLGHYALWDDEANTALTAKAIIRTGDTSASVDDHNFLMYRQGAELENLKNRYLPPLPAYLAAVSFNIFGLSSEAARLPFAFIGLLGLSFMLFTARRLNISATLLAVMVIILISNVSIFLYFRNCRYYSPAIISTFIAIAFFIRFSGSKMQLAWLSLTLICLASSQYLNFAALLVVLALDYAVFRRGELKFSERKWIIFLTTQIIFIILLAINFNPLGKNVVSFQTNNWIAEKCKLFWWNIRDLDACQFGSLPILLLGFLFLYSGPYQRVIRRGGLACIVYIFVITILSPQPVSATSVADVRYLVPLIPVFVVLESLIICSLFASNLKMAVISAVVLAQTNLLHLNFITNKEVNFSFYSFIKELIDPQEEPYTKTTQWIDKNIESGESIWVLPDYMTYPLMFHAPKAVYAWQLNPNQRNESQFSELSPIHFKGLKLPDYIVVFGPMVVQVREMLKEWKKQGVGFTQISTVDVFWKDLYRPELLWRSFSSVPKTDDQTQGVYVFKKQ